MNIVMNESIKDGQEYVYIADFGTGCVKIGTTKNIVQRIHNLSKKHFKPIINYVCIEGGYQTEAFLHQTFKDYWRYSEWFEMGFDEVISVISSLEFVEEKWQEVTQASNIVHKTMEEITQLEIYRWDTIFNVVNSFKFVEECVTEFEDKDLDTLKNEELLYRFEYLGDEEYESLQTYLTEIDTIKDFYWYAFEFQWEYLVSFDLIWLYFSKQISMIKYFEHLLVLLYSVLHIPNEGFYSYKRYTGAEALHENISSVIKNTEYMDEKALFEKVKAYIDDYKLD